MPRFDGYKNYRNTSPTLTNADVGEKLVALGSGAAEGFTDLATMPVRLGSIAAKEMGMISNPEMLNNIEMLDDASYATADYLDNRQAMVNNPNIAMLGNALAPVPPVMAAAKYGAKVKRGLDYAPDGTIIHPSLKYNAKNNPLSEDEHYRLIADQVAENEDRLSSMKSAYDAQQKANTRNIPESLKYKQDAINQRSLGNEPNRQTQLNRLNTEEAEAVEQARLNAMQSTRLDEGILDPSDYNAGSWDDGQRLKAKRDAKLGRKNFYDLPF